MALRNARLTTTILVTLSAASLVGCLAGTQPTGDTSVTVGPSPSNSMVSPSASASVTASPPASAPGSSRAPSSAAPSSRSTVVGPSASVTSVSTAPSASATRCLPTSTTWKGKKRYWTEDQNCYTSPWFEGAWRVMIHFGCNFSPWYDPSPRCRNGQGFHHGVDFDMPVGTTIRAAVTGRVIVNPSTAGPSYGQHRVIIRTGDHDILLGHLSALEVINGQRVSPGDVIGRSGMSGVEDLDGPHLHLEVRPIGGRHTAAIDPWSFAKAVTA